VSSGKTVAFLTAVLLAVWIERADAHGNLHEQIARVSAEIDREPKNADLYLRRGELRRLHSEFPQAATDFETAAAIRPDWPQAGLAKARLALSSGSFEAAVAEMDRLLPKYPEYPEGWLIRARARARLANHAGAAMDYTEIVRRLERPEPEIFLERAAALAASGDNHFPEALNGLEEGLSKIGPVITLNLAALDLELKMKRFDQALRRIDRLLIASKRQDSWLARRGDVQILAGKKDEAQSSYREALEAIAALPPHHQTTSATMELKKRVMEAIAKLEQRR
jgi:predicted Zn-dependent protease